MAVAGGKAEVFFYDTSPFILSYHNQTWAGQLGARRPASAPCMSGPVGQNQVCRD